MENENRYDTTVKQPIGQNLNTEEKVQLYNDWSSTFEENNKQFGYTGNSKCSEVLCKYFPENRENIVVLDVGSGTGLLAEELASKGFKTIDGLDPSPGMLKEAEKKKLYRNLYCSYFTAKPLPFFNPDSYDLLAVVGSFVTGHIPYDAIIEMIRITKPVSNLSMDKESLYDTTVKQLISQNLNTEEKTKLYNDWSSTYELNLKQFGYAANSKCSEVICKYYPENREDIVLLDVGAGTGFLAEELASKGFKTIDGLDPSPGMLKEAEKKKLYRNVFCSYFTSQPLPFFKQDSFDLLAVVGSFNTGHIPYDAIIEMIRITKPGGIICISNRRSPFYESPDYVDKFFPLCDQLEKEGKWSKEEITTYDGFMENADGIIIVYRVK